MAPLRVHVRGLVEENAAHKQVRLPRLYRPTFVLLDILKHLAYRPLAIVGSNVSHRLHVGVRVEFRNFSDIALIGPPGCRARSTVWVDYDGKVEFRICIETDSVLVVRSLTCPKCLDLHRVQWIPRIGIRKNVEWK